jgi:hypothetical protein
MNAPPFPWPDTTRRYPNGARLVVHCMNPHWLDLVWVNQRGEYVYLSTIANPHPENGRVPDFECK